MALFASPSLRDVLTSIFRVCTEAPQELLSSVDKWGGGLIVGVLVLLVLVGLLLCFIFFKSRRPSRATKKVGSSPVSNLSPPQAQVTNSLGSIVTRFFNSVDSPPLTDMPKNASSSGTLPNPTLTDEPSVASRSSVVPNWGLTVFLYKQLLEATNNFSTTNRLGDGGFGTVYKGTLPDGKMVAIKLLKKVNDIDFHTEIDAISRVMHKHIVSLTGYCIHGGKRLIVFEYVENKSLEHHLHGGNNVQVLNWANRWKIALGTAKGLEYLHNGCYPTIIHRDVKPANILLNINFEAKVADFGIAKICPESFQNYLQTFPAGTMGYLDPEYFQTHNLSVKSDVYSFGIVLLELVTGCRQPLGQDLINKIRKALGKRNFHAIVDPRLQNKYDTREMLLIVACADACIRKMAKDRHHMKKIVQVLEGITPHGELKMKTRRWSW